MHDAPYAHNHEWETPLHPHAGPLRIGIGGPVGSGKTAVVEQLCRALRDRYSLAVVTNDIYTREDAEILLRAGALAPERIVGVETGGCPHTAIRDDISMNDEAVRDLISRLGHVDLVLIESGGDNLAAAFSPELVDRFVYVIDVAQGEKLPRKGGPGLKRSDLLLVNKIDLAPYVGADLSVMNKDTRVARAGRPYLFTNMRDGTGVGELVAWVETQLRHG